MKTLLQSLFIGSFIFGASAAIAFEPENAPVCQAHATAFYFCNYNNIVTQVIGQNGQILVQREFMMFQQDTFANCDSLALMANTYKSKIVGVSRLAYCSRNMLTQIIVSAEGAVNQSGTTMNSAEICQSTAKIINEN